MLGIGLKINNVNKAAGSVESLYQQWDGYPDTPELTESYPYQIVSGFPTVYLWISTGRFYDSAGMLKNEAVARLYSQSGESWGFVQEFSAGSALDGSSALIFANNDVYTNNSFTSIFFDKNA